MDNRLAYGPLERVAGLNQRPFGPGAGFLFVEEDRQQALADHQQTPALLLLAGARG